MTSDGSVLQAAAGIQGNGSSWYVYAEFDTEVGSVTPSYQQILNSSQPQMKQNATISISIYRSKGGTWSLRVVDGQTGSSVVSAFPASEASGLKPGDQEAFALESYSTNQTTFEGMGNLTLDALMVDGSQVSHGFYAYGDWAPALNPLFVVGGAGTSPPLFITLGLSASSAVWSYDAQWETGNAGYMPPIEETLVLPLVLGLVVIAAAWVLLVNMRSLGAK
jgi:hypothetical protein